MIVICIFVKVDDVAFNRALLFNIGFREAMKHYSWECFIFHDVDLLPEDRRNLYQCFSKPRHMYVCYSLFFVTVNIIAHEITRTGSAELNRQGTCTHVIVDALRSTTDFVRPESHRLYQLSHGQRLRHRMGPRRRN